MRTPRPYGQVNIGDDEILREFSGDVDPGDLIWHQDKRDRRVTVIEGKGWKLQLETGLPFIMVPGESYLIPHESWHRLLKGHGQLRVKIVEFDG